MNHKDIATGGHLNRIPRKARDASSFPAEKSQNVGSGALAREISIF